ncbi:L-aspartate oxidase [Salinicoccus carnicancri]|uniref:L-aspartate oxidase n=1 Tax=Salinicoccus carnicancri TaxID=558170 RepID=UPI0002FD383B|nr:FAD-binding protein [Salinicoccus carnicancri]
MYDVIVVGSGLAALSFIDALDENRTVLLFTKDRVDDHNSRLAQGGICYSFHEDDHGGSHMSDTYEAGSCMGDREIIRRMIEKSHGLIKSYMNDGMSFDRNGQSELAYGLEGAHSIPRILHAGGDRTGEMMTRFFLDRLKNRAVKICAGHTVVDIMTDGGDGIKGVVSMDAYGNARRYTSRDIVLATGGYSGLFTPNSGASETMGTGHILALRAGARLRHMEMVQFHPTLLGSRNRTYGLVSEAVRGAGAVIVNDKGRRIMDTVHPLKDLAPRDVTSIEVYRQEGEGHLCHLDISSIADFKNRFPGIYRAAKKHFPRELSDSEIPITTGAHYTMGGVMAGIDGHTGIPGLRVIGEAASTNFHGANRLASNSLLEALVTGNEAALAVNGTKRHVHGDIAPMLPEIPYLEPSLCDAILNEVTETIGFERTGEELEKMFDKVQALLEQAESRRTDLYGWERYCKIMTIYSMLHGCLQRRETRGSHNRIDFPGKNEELRNQEIRLFMKGGRLVAERVENQREAQKLLY